MTVEEILHSRMAYSPIALQHNMSWTLCATLFLRGSLNHTVVFLFRPRLARLRVFYRTLFGTSRSLREHTLKLKPATSNAGDTEGTIRVISLV
jgi:hypothetical protein